MLAVASFLVNTRTTGIVGLAHRGTVAAAIHVAHHIAAVDGDRSIVVHLASRDARDFFCLRAGLDGFACLWIYSPCVNGFFIGIAAFATAVDIVSDEAIIEGDLGVVVDVAVLAAAIKGTSDATLSCIRPIIYCGIELVNVVQIRMVRIIGFRFVVLRSGIGGGIVDHDHGAVNVGAMGVGVAGACDALAAAKHVAVVLAGFLELSDIICIGEIEQNRIHYAIDQSILLNRITIFVPRTHEVLSSDADTASLDVDGGDAGAVFVIELVRPADVEWVIKWGACNGIVLDGVGDVTNRGQLAAAINALLDPTALDVDLGVAKDAACQRHWCVSALGDGGMRGVVRTTLTRAIHVAPDGAIGNGHLGIVGHGTQLSTTIDIAPDLGAAAAHVDTGFPRLGQFGPYGVDRTVQQGQAAHGATKDVTAYGTFGVMIDRLIVVTDGAAFNVYRDVTIGVTRLELAIERVGDHLFGISLVGDGRADVVKTHRSQTTTAIDGAEQMAICHVHHDIAADVTCRECQTIVATASTEDVAVPSGLTRRAKQSGTEVHFCAVEHVTVFGTTEDGTVDSRSTAHVDDGLIDLCKVPIGIIAIYYHASTAAEQVGVGAGTVQGTELAARHGDCRHTSVIIGQITATYGTQHTAAIDTVVNLAARNVDVGVARNPSKGI